MQNKKLISGTTVYLLVLLCAALFYLGVIYPRFSAQLSALDAEDQNLRTQIKLLEPYELKAEEMRAKAAEADAAYEASTALVDPSRFSDILFDSAAKGEVQLESASVADGGEIALTNGYIGHLYTADVTVSLVPGASPVAFLQALETQSGAGVFVTALQLSPTKRLPEQGPDAMEAERAAAAQSAQKAEQSAQQAASNTSYNQLKTRADAAAADARNKAAISAQDPGNAALQVDAQIAQQLAASLAQQLENAKLAQDSAGASAQKQTDDAQRDTMTLAVSFYTASK